MFQLAEERLESGASLGVRYLTQILTPVGEQIERDELCRDLLGERVHSRLGGVDSQLERVELGDVVDDHHHLTVDHRAGRQLGEGGLEFREVPEQRPTVARVETRVVASPCDGAEPVPLRLVDPSRTGGRPLPDASLHRVERRGKRMGRHASQDTTGDDGSSCQLA